MPTYSCDWNSVFAPPIPDELLFNRCHAIASFKGWRDRDFWCYFREKESWENQDCRSIIIAIIEKFPDDVLEFFAAPRPLSPEEAQAELDRFCEVIFEVLKDIAEFMKIGD
jgi:hypothetical protein